MIKNKNISIIYKLVIIVCGIIGVLGQLEVFEGRLTLGSLTYFTLLSNIVVIIYYIFDIKSLIINNKTFNYVIKYLALMSITVTFLIAHFILGAGFSMNSSRGISLLLLHYVVPIMTILDWLLFDEKGHMELYDPFKWTIGPMVYATLVFIIARFSNNFFNGIHYPYPFLDLDINPLSKVLITIVVLYIFFLILGYIYRFIDLLLKKRLETK